MGALVHDGVECLLMEDLVLKWVQVCVACTGWSLGLG